MQMKLELTAILDWSNVAELMVGSEPDVVKLFIGGTHLVDLPVTADPTRAGHGDDSTYFDSERRRIVEDTLRPYLLKMFTNEGDDQ